MHIMTSTAQNNIVIKGHKRAADSEGPLLLGGRSLMNEKIYKTMASSGAGSLALGIVVLVTGLVTGIRERCETAQKKIRDINLI